MDMRFNVILTGISSNASSEEKIIERMSHLFGLSPEVVQQLFVRVPVAVKRGVDQATAEEYQQMIQIAGAACEIRLVHPAAAAPQAPGAAAPHPTAAQAAAGVGPEVANQAQQAAPATPYGEGSPLEPMAPGHPEEAEFPADPTDPDLPWVAKTAAAPTTEFSAQEALDKGASILTIDDRVLQRAATLAALPEEGAISADEPASAASVPPSLAGKVCPKCGYVRQGSEVVPDYECPKCGIVYFKYEAYLQRQQQAESPPDKAAASSSPGKVALLPAGQPRSGTPTEGQAWGRRLTAIAQGCPAQAVKASQLRAAGFQLVIGAQLLMVLGRVLQHVGVDEHVVTTGSWRVTTFEPNGVYWIGSFLIIAIALPLAIWGGLRVARSKWRHDAWSLIACVPLAGLIVLHLLGDRRPAEPRSAQDKPQPPAPPDDRPLPGAPS